MAQLAKYVVTAQTYDLKFYTFIPANGYELAEGIFIREKQTSEFLIDDDDILGLSCIRSREVAPTQQVDPHRREVSVTHDQLK